MKQSCIVIIQSSKYHWKLVSESGNVIKDDIYLNDALQAEEYVRSYVSSYPGWTYKVVLA